MESLCINCKRICKIRNADRETIVLSCSAKIEDEKIIQRVMIQTKLI